ncbi:4677_t:CDS:2, partial [Entrophospora sp. SA101]
MELINDLVVEETDNGNSELDEQIINSFSIDSWKEWKLKSGNRVIDILKNASNLNGHKLRQGSLDTMNKELETLRQRGPEASLQDPMNKFFCAILSDFNKFVYPNNALIQRGIDSEKTTKSILELHEEHNYNIFEENSPLYRGLPRTVTPCKDIHRDGINSICTESEPD